MCSASSSMSVTAELPLCGWLRRPVDGFFTLYRNGDGMITDENELFGNATPYSAVSNNARR